MTNFKMAYNDIHFKIYLAITTILTVYFLMDLFEAITIQKNMYDFMVHITNILTVSYVIVPFFLIVLSSNLSANSMNNLILLRYNKKSTYYNAVLTSIFFLVTKFLVLIMGIVVTLSLFSLSFRNEWSVFAQNYFKEFQSFLDNYSPLLYVANSLLLLWCFLLFFGLLYFLLLLFTKNTAISLIGVIVLVVANMAITISHLEILSRIFFTKYLDFVQYIYANKIPYSLFPIGMYVYWIFLLLLLYGLGYRMIHKLDLDLKKGV
jgi:hypothetical protein